MVRTEAITIRRGFCKLDTMESIGQRGGIPLRIAKSFMGTHEGSTRAYKGLRCFWFLCHEGFTVSFMRIIKVEYALVGVFQRSEYL